MMDNVEVKTKRCSKCGRVLPLADFNKQKRAKDGLDYWCKECHKAYNAEYRSNNKDKIAEYFQANKEKAKAYNAEYQANYKDPQKNPMGWARNMIGHYRRMDRDRGFDDSQTITAEWFLQNIAYSPCVHCGKQGIGLIGCNRIDNTKGHTQDNVESCCFKCNLKENVRDQLERGLHVSCKGKARHKTA